MYPGIPEYINEQGRGMYTYITGSASWLLLTMVTEVFGVKGKLGDLLLEPKLVAEQFDPKGRASIMTIFAERELEVVYTSTGSSVYGDYRIQSVALDGSEVTLQRISDGVVIPRAQLNALLAGKVHLLEVELA
jgi:cellobiose phosphorylase